METIVYIYLDRNEVCGLYHKKEFDMGDYRLLRVGVSRDFLRILQEKEPTVCTPECDVYETHPARNGKTEESKKSRRIGKRVLHGRRQAKEAEHRRQLQLAEENNLRSRFWQELLVNPDRTGFCCEEQLPFLEGAEFNGYLEEEWVQHMMKYTSLHHFLFLGRVNFMSRLLLPYVKKMKSMRWILPERQYGPAEQALVEDICDRYGLLVEVQLLKQEAEYRSLRLTGNRPLMIVDFSAEEKITASDLPAGSIWLDMGASETKRQRIEERERKIHYFSLKKEWKQPQKALFHLDTAHKNGYNT